MYSKKVMKHFLHPKGLGKIKNPSSVGKVGNFLCGDILWCYIKVDKGKIKDIKIETYGCAIAIACSSVLTSLAKGKTIKKALKITNNDIIKELGKVPKIKVHCSLLAVDALHEAIYNYFKKNKLKIPKELQKRHKTIQQTLENIERRHTHMKI